MVELRIVDQPTVLRRAGEKFREMVMLGATDSMRSRTVNNILRCPVLLHREESVLRPYLGAVQTLFRDTTFVHRCKRSGTKEEQESFIKTSSLQDVVGLYIYDQITE